MAQTLGRNPQLQEGSGNTSHPVWCRFTMVCLDRMGQPGFLCLQHSGGWLTGPQCPHTLEVCVSLRGGTV